MGFNTNQRREIRPIRPKLTKVNEISLFSKNEKHPNEKERSFIQVHAIFDVPLHDRQMYFSPLFSVIRAMNGFFF